MTKPTMPDGRVVLIVTGGRDFTDRVLVNLALDSAREPVALFHGAATGADTLASEWAQSAGVLEQPFPVTKADWYTQGRRAGPGRNAKMLDAAFQLAVRMRATPVLVTFYGGRGTADCTRQARERGILVLDGMPFRWPSEYLESLEADLARVKLGASKTKYPEVREERRREAARLEGVIRHVRQVCPARQCNVLLRVMGSVSGSGPIGRFIRVPNAAPVFVDAASGGHVSTRTPIGGGSWRHFTGTPEAARLVVGLAGFVSMGRGLSAEVLSGCAPGAGGDAVRAVLSAAVLLGMAGFNMPDHGSDAVASAVIEIESAIERERGAAY